MCLLVYVCLCLFVCPFFFVFVSASACTCLYLYLYRCVSTSVQVHICVPTCVLAYLAVRMFLNLSICSFIYACLCIYRQPISFLFFIYLPSLFLLFLLHVHDSIYIFVRIFNPYYCFCIHILLFPFHVYLSLFMCTCFAFRLDHPINVTRCFGSECFEASFTTRL